MAKVIGSLLLIWAVVILAIILIAATSEGVNDIALGKVNNDDFIDIVITASIQKDQGVVIYFENIDGGSSWEETLICNDFKGACSVEGTHEDN